MSGSLRLDQRLVSGALARAGALRRVRTDRPVIVLTYEDGPDPRQTPQILAALADTSSSATFFMLLGRARRWRSVVRAVVEQEHEVALHGVDHRPFTSHSPETLHRSMTAAKSELEDLAGSPVRLVMPPYGLQSLASASAARTAGLRTLLWNRAAEDWVNVPHERRVEAATRGAKRVDVLLAHDAHAGPEDGADDGPAPGLDRRRLARDLLSALADQGLGARSFAAVVDAAAFTLSPG